MKIDDSLQVLTHLSQAIVFLPLLAALIIGLLSSYIPRRLAHFLTIAAVGISFVCSLFLLRILFNQPNQNFEIPIYTWADTGDYKFHMGFLIDKLSALMIAVVTFVSWMVHIYTIGYMRHDPGYERFFSYIALFTFFMLTLVSANNFLQLFLGWEGVGLMSYLLIGFWFKKESAIFASFKAFIVNRIGDLGFIVGIAAVFYVFGTLDFLQIFETIPSIVTVKPELYSLEQSLEPSIILGSYAVPAITFICICLFIGAMGKSAQIPLHVWLPDSMEGPTPISALIHAATMVTAGVFMVARLSPLFEYSDVALNVILGVGSATAFLMGLMAVVQQDIKRIIAYSTLSQLGYMMVALGASAYSIGIFHLVTHAFFKALLFLGAGSVIMAFHHQEQNIWRMGNLKKYMPITYGTMLIGSLALVGFPFTSGFYSKDLIIEAEHASNLGLSSVAYYLILTSVFITGLYTFRLFFVVFHTHERMNPGYKSELHESPWVVWVPLVLLAIASIMSGFLIYPILEVYFSNTMQALSYHPAMTEIKQSLGFTSASSVFSFWYKTGLHSLISSPVWLGIAGMITAYLCYVKFPVVPQRLKQWLGLIYTILNYKYGFDLLYEKLIAPLVRGLGFLCWKIGDQWAIDGIGVNGTAQVVGKTAEGMRTIQTGYLYHYALMMALGFLILLLWLIWL